MWTAVTLLVAYGAIFGLYAWWAIGHIAAGASLLPFLLALPFVYLAVPLLVVLVWFGLAWVFRAERPPEVRLGPAGTLRLFWHELATIAGNAPRMILYRVLLPDPPPARAELPVLLVHGVLCNAGVWHAFARWAARKGIGPVYALSYGPPLASIELFAEQAAARIDAILAATHAKRVVVIAHSMGGLVMRAYLRRHGGAKVARVVTVGTPHEGSVHAWMAAGTSLAQIRPGNPWLAALGAPGGDDLPPFVSIWSWHDSMVAPQTSSQIAFGDNIVLGGVAHNALLRDPQVFGHLAEEIERAR
jgi:triacylglycerol esterase/lipase EstA (alpha/beta hydrolase family)